MGHLYQCKSTKIQIFGLKNSIKFIAKQIWLSGHLVENFKIISSVSDIRAFLRSGFYAFLRSGFYAFLKSGFYVFSEVRILCISEVRILYISEVRILCISEVRILCVF